MSSSYRVYVGPYFKCAPTIRQTTVRLHACRETTCARVGQEVRDLKARFCPYCSAAIQDYDVPHKVESPDTGEVIEVLNERLYIANNSQPSRQHIWLPNRQWGAASQARKFIFDEQRYDVVITAAQVGAESEAFNEHFDLEQETLKLHYGADKVSLCWGVIGDYA